MTSPSNPVASVVIPAYNAERFIAEALHSTLSQSYQPLQVIVVDDGSTDSTRQRVAEFGDRVAYVHRKNSGGYPGVPRNTGLSHASGDCILFLDADDIMLPDRIRAQMDFLRMHPAVGCVFGNYQNFFEGDHPEEEPHFQTCRRLSEMLGAKAHLILESGAATALLLRENIGIPSSLAIRRNVLVQVPGFPPHLRIGEDFEFAYRIARQFPVGVVNRVLVRRRFHGSNLTGDTLRTLRDQVISFRELQRSELDARNMQQLDDRLHKCDLGLARIYANQGEYRRALAHGVRALRGSLPRRWGRIPQALRSLLRTIAIAAGMKQPAP